MRIIPRAEWGARHDNGAGSAPLPAAEVWLHHSVTIAPDLIPPFDDDYAAIRTLEAIGEERFGRGISYTWPITPAGLIFEGHGVDRIGSHTANRNSIARAICFVGNYDVAAPTTAQLRAAAWLLQEAKRRGWIRAPRLNGGHRDLKATGCPGAKAYALIGHINSLAAGPDITDVNPDPLEEDEVAPIPFLAKRPSTGEIFVADGQYVSYRHVKTMDDLAALKWHWENVAHYPTDIQEIEAVEAVLGVRIGDTA